MSPQTVPAGLQLRSLVKPDGELELSLISVDTPAPAPDEVVVRIEATPINPSDIGLLFGAADLGTVKVSGTPASPVVTARIPERLMKSMAARVGQSLPVGNEGAGVVVAAGVVCRGTGPAGQDRGRAGRGDVRAVPDASRPTSAWCCRRAPRRPRARPAS